MADDKRRNFGYWLATALLALGFTAGGVMDLIGNPDMIKQLTDLGYPAYLARFLGVAKLLAVAAILAPRFPRLKEWAYAGITIDLVGATYSHVAHGDGADKIMPPVVFLLVAAASYLLRPGSRKLPSAPKD